MDNKRDLIDYTMANLNFLKDIFFKLGNYPFFRFDIIISRTAPCLKIDR
jgi:hypothetical protein